MDPFDDVLVEILGRDAGPCRSAPRLPLQKFRSAQVKLGIAIPQHQILIFNSVAEMEYDTKTPQSVTSDPKSFASDSVRNRWPVILTQAIDDVHRSVSKVEDPEKQAEGKKIIEQLANLKYEVLHDRKLTPIVNDQFPEEVAAYNKEIEDRGNPSWLDVTWLFSECYMYRRISTFFSLSKHWKNYDIFARQKIDTFRTSRNAVLELATRYRELVEALHADKDATHDAEAEKVLFSEMFEICLWGNATDLSLLTNMTYEDIQKLQGSEARKAAEKNILINNLPEAYELLKKARDEGKKERRVDFVLDNAGFELYVDLILAGFLLATGLATQIVLRPKSIPWFVSDVLPGDFSALLNAISNPRAFFETQSEDEKLQDKVPVPLTEGENNDLSFVFQHWAEIHAEGQLVMRPNRYWTAGGSFWRLPKEAPELLEDLKPAELVIFKGDLNYRKLTGDAHWDPTTPFTEALGPMGPSSGVNVLSLRTCKADVVVGLKPGQDEELKKIGGDIETGARKWAWKGKWAVVCLSKAS
ncbi:Hairy/enhancer-of-split with YRPW motif protein 2 [Amphichorda felina]